MGSNKYISYNVYYVKYLVQDCGLYKPSVATARHREDKKKYLQILEKIDPLLENIVHGKLILNNVEDDIL